MKKFMKICGILALVMIVGGMGMSLAAGAVQGPITFSQLRNSIRLDGDLEEDILSKLGDLDRLDSGVRFSLEDELKGNFAAGYDVLSGDAEQVFDPDVSAVRELEIEAGGCTVVLEDSEDEDFHVSVKKAKSYQGYVSDGTLHLKCIRKSQETGSDCTLLLAIPAGYTFDEVEMVLGAGELRGKSTLTASELDIELGAGAITLDDLDVGRLDAEVGAGSLEVSGGIREFADVECAAGSVVFRMGGAETDYNYTVSVAMGDIRIGSTSFSGLSRTKDIDNNASAGMELECAAGSIEVHFAE
ncbi:MAG: DUF4097 family beta strand repeat-containing protein [Muribaculum sp.]|nr:DUF4097 family beta strand repeat-containing protein [Muribaculum sp.]